MDSETHDEPSPQPLDSPRPKYEKPAILWRDRIDIQSLAVGCGKSIPSDPVCSSGGTSS